MPMGLQEKVSLGTVHDVEQGGGKELVIAGKFLGTEYFCNKKGDLMICN